MIRFSLFGIPINVQPFFWVTMSLIGMLIMQNVDSTHTVLLLALFVLAGFLSILVHELGHAGMARIFGSPSEIVLQAFGGYAMFNGASMNRGQIFLVTAAGPGLQILLALAAKQAIILAVGNTGEDFLRFLSFLYVISLFWALLNLLPVLPLDGGQLVNVALGPKRFRTTLWVTVIAGSVLALAMLVYFKTFIFPIFLGMFAWQAYQQLRQDRW